MSHHKLREEKNCLNCGATVEERFCPNCGQENSINRPSFHHLFKHFFEDLLHYDSGFWKTMKTLLFKPGIMVKEYLSGKRKTYVPPVKLYIFVSFIAFFLPHILSDHNAKEAEGKSGQNMKIQKFEGFKIREFKKVNTIEKLDSIQNILPENEKLDSTDYALYKSVIAMPEKLDSLKSISGKTQKELTTIGLGERKIAFGFEDGKGFTFNDHYKEIKTTAQFDSIHQSLPDDKKINWLLKPLARKTIEINERGLGDGNIFNDNFFKLFMNNLPKALFFYLPVFAFLLWLFHGKRKWLYYDHGVFTLYYFSFLLILTTFTILFNWLLAILDHYFDTSAYIANIVGFPVFLFSVGYAFFYFFRAHRRVYEEKRWVSRTKSFALFWINCFLLIFTLLVYTAITFLII